MLGNPHTVSRPRPPAQMRRSSSMKTTNSSPPPPYASSFLSPSSNEKSEGSLSTILGSPITAALQLFAHESQHTDVSEMSPFAHREMIDWLKGRSHDELSELLLKAGEVIKQRESDLDRTNSLCKTLYDDNTSLQSKHKALLSRLPITPPRHGSPVSGSPLLSPSSSSFSSRHSASPSTDSLIYSPPISRSSSNEDPFFSSPSRSTPHKFGNRHVRKISVTPYDISLLSDQNTELLMKVEKLESESASHDLAGRKMLRKMEKEINALRDELEAVREKEVLNAARAKESNSEKQPKRSKGKRASRGLTLDTRQREDHASEGVRDFAPSGPLTSLSSSPGRSKRQEADEDTSSSETSTPTSATALEEQQRLIITQVLSKMTELEENNLRLQSQQAETAAQLVAIQKETESLGKVYEGLESLTVTTGEGFEGQDEPPPTRLEDEAEGSDIHDTTIKFKSFRKTLEGRATDDDDPFNSPQSSIPKSRKSVLGLFAGSSPSENSSRRNSSDHDGLLSPALSTLSGFNLGPFDSALSAKTPSPANGTLSNELGLVGGLTWDGPSDHLRSSSLYGFSSLSHNANSTPSPSPSPVDFNKIRRQDDDEWEPNFKFPKTPTLRDGNGIQLTLEPPTPQPDQYDANSPSQRQAARYRRMTQTVRARTARWVDGRFTENVLSPKLSPRDFGSVRGKGLLSEEDEVEEIGSHLRVKEQLMSDSESSSVGSSKTMKASPIQSLSSVLDSVVERFTGRQNGEQDESSKEDPDAVDAVDNSVEIFVSPAPPIKEKKAAGVGEIVLEIWLWLQFAVIILVFLWAMAKRGPKSVLGDGRRTSSVSIRRTN